MLKRLLFAALPVAAGLAAIVPANATAIDVGAPYTDWNPGYIGFPSNVEESKRADCTTGSDDCIRRTIAEMYRRFHATVPVCDDNNIFSLTYTRVTEDIETAVDQGFYPDLYWINHQDAVFARTYFLAYDNFLAGRIDLVPPAWRIAFSAGANQEVEGIGNLLLSINAHVNRDMPFVLYHSGLLRPDGQTREEEHFSYNARLRELYTPVIKEMAHRFDASTDDYDVPGVFADDEAFFSVLRLWRQTTWQAATRLANAGSDAERREVAAEIEDYATTQAIMIYAGSAYLPGEDSSARNLRCAQFGGQNPDYNRGSEFARPLAKAGVKIRGRRARLKLRCPDGVGPCVGVVSLNADKAVLGRAPYELMPREGGSIVVPLKRSAAAKRLDSPLRAVALSRLRPGDSEAVSVKLERRGR